jgi:hypothetical protein
MRAVEALGMFMQILRGRSSSMKDAYELHVSKKDYAAARAAYDAELTYPTLPWRPIAELADRYENGLLLLAPELVDLDCNPSGVGMGYWQDDGLTWSMTQEECDRLDDSEDWGSWMACKWSMTNDEWSHVVCTPTHYLKLRGAT